MKNKSHPLTKLWLSHHYNSMLLNDQNLCILKKYVHIKPFIVNLCISEEVHIYHHFCLSSSVILRLLERAHFMWRKKETITKLHNWLCTSWCSSAGDVHQVYMAHHKHHTCEADIWDTSGKYFHLFIYFVNWMVQPIAIEW